MKLTILGCGTSTGVPLPGCGCKVCLSGDQRNHRSRTSALITTDDGKNILIDAGTDLRHQSLRHKISRIDAVLFTHHHCDHILGVDDLRCFNFINRHSIPCYGSHTTLSEIERIFHYIFSKESDYEGGLLADLTMHRVHNYVPFEVCGVTVTPFLIWHGKIQVTGYRIGDFVYATDCKVIPQESKTIIKGARFCVLDALRHKQHKTHMTVDEAVSTATELEFSKTFFVHMSHDLDYEETNSKLPQNMKLAHDGLVIES